MNNSEVKAKRRVFSLLAISLLPMTTGVVASAVAQIGDVDPTMSN